jgi:HAAS
MSDHEFENYLALLSRLLRLDVRQREQIAGELRVHLEDRLDDLLARGVPRHEAVRQALEEFGDAAALAADFASISRNKRRRWLMRVTTFSVAATVLIAAGVFTFWPGRNAGPGIAAVVAQNPQKSEQPHARPPEMPIEQQRLYHELSKRIDIAFVETPLKDVVAYLHDLTQVPIHLRTKKLDEAGVAVDSAVTMSFQQIRLSTALDLILDDLQLVYYDKDGVLVITTPDDADEHLEIRVYDCRDLLAMPTPPGVMKPGAAAAGQASHGGGGMFAVADDVSKSAAPAAGESGAPQPSPEPTADGSAISPRRGGAGGMGAMGGGMGMMGPRANAGPVVEQGDQSDDLIDLITSLVDPDNWADVGGTSAITSYNGLLAISTTARTHDKVERLLNMLREAGLEKPQMGRVVR